MRNSYIPPDHFSRILRRSSPYDRALYILLSDTGFRVDDLLAARQWQMRTDTLTLYEHKTRRTRSVLLSDRAKSAINTLWQHVAIRHPLRYFFARRRYDRGRAKLHRSTVDRHFQRAVKAAGLAGYGYTVHSLRKIYSRNLYARCRSVLQVQRDLGHTSLSTTLLYLHDLD